MRHTLAVLVENHAGVLSKVSGLFSRRGFNIESLAVGVTEDPAVSRITIVVNGDDYTVEQVEKQLNKVIPVIKVKTLSVGEYISREVMLIKVGCSARQRDEIMRVAELMNARIEDVSTTSLTLQLTDTSERNDTLLSLLRPFGVREVARTGAIAIEKGAGVTKSAKKNP